ncbi:DUF6468 domain-containing protein [Roseibium sp. RKSG952]|uniref:DUF6468 domain-containing protein n=1 Tax=Roseibium sp. RKSG952 TaxID=2529384 RepID=UPI0012BCE29D|nr:DUF6468 domain-containing protein [Roseibium sp. RKSG952]MTH97627.1 chemotaxis protein [Roseibium sp. RKSG952]
MSTLPIGMMIEALVAVLLVVTIGYCWMLNNRLQRLRSDEQTLRATISELMTATEIAERAIIGLKATANEADETLGNRLQEAERMSLQLSEQLDEGDAVFDRISQIAVAARTTEPGRGAPSQQFAPATAQSPRTRPSRTQEIRSAASEAAARLERIRRRAEGAAA